MTRVLDEVLTANEAYAAGFGDKGSLALPPARRFAILTCMDARLDPAKFAGLKKGDAHVIRNAGGRASDDAIHSLVISHKLLGTNEWLVIHHTDCGMETFTDEVIRSHLAKMKAGERLAFIDAHATEVVAAVIWAPAFLSGLSPTELGIVKQCIEARTNPEIAAAKAATLRALTETERGWRNAANQIRERGGLDRPHDGIAREPSHLMSDV
jgi:carbonic anhydrase